VPPNVIEAFLQAEVGKVVGADLGKRRKVENLS
jgi:hypothetical protein